MPQSRQPWQRRRPVSGRPTVDARHSDRGRGARRSLREARHRAAAIALSTRSNSRAIRGLPALRSRPRDTSRAIALIAGVASVIWAVAGVIALALLLLWWLD